VFLLVLLLVSLIKSQSHFLSPLIHHAAGNVVVCGHSNGVALINGNAIASSLAVSYRPQAIAISPDGKQIAVGGEDMVRFLNRVCFPCYSSR